MRRLYIFLIVLGVIVFLAISGLLARAFSVGGAENSALTALVRAEARGDRAAVVALISGCATSAGCQARAAAVATSLRRGGDVSVIQITPSTGFSLGSTLGTARIAWLVGSSLPRVQCVRVRHAGDVLSGFEVQLLKVSARIASNADCPRRF